MLISSSMGITVLAARDFFIPHQAPEQFTLFVLGAVIICKEFLFRKVITTGLETGSTAVIADAWHHRSDAATSAAAFIGISVARWCGPGWEMADDWAALVAAVIIGLNGVRLLRAAVNELMDRTPEPESLQIISDAACSVPGVRAIEKLRVRKQGLGYFVDLHVQADPTMILHDAHILSGKVKGASAARRRLSSTSWFTWSRSSRPRRWLRNGFMTGGVDRGLARIVNRP